MKQNFISLFSLFLLFFIPAFNILGMEERSGQNSNLLSNIPALLGYSRTDVKNNINKKSEYLEKLQLLASLSLAHNELHKKAAIINKTTNQILESLDGYFYRAAFEYTDRPCDVQQIFSGSQVTFRDGDQETKVFKDAFVLTTAEAKAAYLQAKNLLKLKSVNINDRSDHLLANLRNIRSIEKTHSRLDPFISTLLMSDNHELQALGKWLRITVAHEQQMTAVGHINSLLRTIVLQRDPYFLKNSACLEAIAKLGEKIKQQTLSILPIINTQCPAFYGLVDIGGKLLNFAKEYEDSGDLPTCNRYEKLRFLFIDAYELANATYASNNAFYNALKKELDSLLKDKSCKNRLELIKKYAHPLYAFPEIETGCFPETQREVGVVLKNNVIKDEVDEWTIDAVKGSELKRKKIVQLEQGKKKKIAQKKNRQKKIASARLSKVSEKEVEGEKESPATKKTIQRNQSPQQNKSAKLSSIIYDQRVLRWFDPAFLDERRPNEQSLLYHTMPFRLDEKVLKHGVPVKQKNRMAYYLGGEIHYMRGRRIGQKETVLFAICKDAEGVCFHRGFERKNDSLFEEFENSKFEYNFPPISDELPGEKSRLNVSRQVANKKSILEHKPKNKFCIEINDPENGVKLVLFKSSFNA